MRAFKNRTSYFYFEWRANDRACANKQTNESALTQLPFRNACYGKSRYNANTNYILWAIVMSIMRWLPLLPSHRYKTLCANVITQLEILMNFHTHNNHIKICCLFSGHRHTAWEQQQQQQRTIEQSTMRHGQQNQQQIQRNLPRLRFIRSRLCTLFALIFYSFFFVLFHLLLCVYFVAFLIRCKDEHKNGQYSAMIEL